MKEHNIREYLNQTATKLSHMHCPTSTNSKNVCMTHSCVCYIERIIKSDGDYTPLVDCTKHEFGFLKEV